MPESNVQLSDRKDCNRLEISHLEYKGEFWKPCPGTTAGYLCCGYQILTPSTGCGMYCTYCVLQAYFENHNQVIYTNFSDLEKEVHEKMKTRTGVTRFGTGEFGDSLFIDHLSHASEKIATLLEPYNALVEFKTKSINIKGLNRIRQPQKVIIGFSLNTPAMIELLEKGTSSLKSRLQAAQQCIEMGFYVAFHFDPMFWYKNWREEYRAVVKMIFSTIKEPSKIAWVSLGGFRTMPSLKGLLKKKGTHLPLFRGEMINGADGKLRYFRPYRVAFYSEMQNEFEHFDPEVTLYLCMESPEVWQESGMIKRIPQGLIHYLDRRAEQILTI